MAAMVIEVPDDLKPVGAVVAKFMNELAGRRARLSASKRSVDYAEVEEALGAALATVERAAHEVLLRAVEVDAPAVRIEGREHVRVGRSTATYYTLAGPVEIERALYRARDERNGKVVDAISLRAGVVGDGWLPRTAQAIAHAVQQTTSREAAECARQLGRLPYSRSSFERVAHLVGTQYVTRNADIEEALIREAAIPAAAASVSAGLDRVSVAMEEPRPRPPGRRRKGEPKRPIVRAFRMAYVATITLHDADGNALHTIRYGRMPQTHVPDLLDGMAADIEELLRRRPDLQVVTLTDGAPELIDWMARHINRERLGVDVVRIIDYWHVAEKLGKAAVALFGTDLGDAVLGRWKMLLLNRADGARQVLAELRATGRENLRVGDTRPVHDAITYLDNNHERMAFAAARRRGLPIGTGNTEATCKSLVQVRMKRPGSRWKHATGNHIIQLRSLALSDRWDRGVQLALRPLRRSVQAAA